MSPDNATQPIITNLIPWIFSQYDNYKGWVSIFYLENSYPSRDNCCPMFGVVAFFEKPAFYSYLSWCMDTYP